VSCAKTAEVIEMPFGIWTWIGPRKHVLAGGTHWRHFANAIELFMCCGDAAFLSNYFDHFFVETSALGRTHTSAKQSIHSRYRRAAGTSSS